MDYRTATSDIKSMSPDELRNYFSIDDTSGTMPEKADDYYSASSGSTKTMSADEIMEAGGATGSKMNIPDEPSTEPGQAPGPVNDYSEFRDKYGLEYNEDHAKMKSPGAYSRSSGGDGFASDDGAIFTESGVYVGTAKGSENEDGEMVYDNYDSLRSASEGIKTDAEGKGFTDFSSLSDVAGAVHWLTKDDKKKDTAKKEPEVYNKSTKLAEAEAGVKAFDDVILPRQGDVMFGKMPDYAQQYADAFQTNLRNDPDYAWKFKGEDKQGAKSKMDNAKINFDGALDR